MKIFNFYGRKIFVKQDKNRILLTYKYQKKPMKLIITGGCWQCEDRALTHNGYPHISFNHKTCRLNRFMYCLFNNVGFGAIKNKIILHSCDNRLCVNPDHLSTGTHIDNMQEMREKERSARGDRNGSAVLSEATVLLIRESSEDMPNSYYADMFGVSESTIRSIRKRETWKHVM